MSDKKITANDIRQALYARYKNTEWLLGFEVGNSTGGQCCRHADAVAINTYPSRGFDVKEFEIKISRSDLKKELDNADKAEAVAQYCNEWYLVVPKGLTKDMEIPPNWGILELVGEKLIQKKEAKYMQNKIDHGFMCAFIKGMQRCQDQVAEDSREKALEKLKLEAQNEIRYKLDELKRYEQQDERFREATGWSIRYMHEREFRKIALIHSLDDYRMKPEYLDHLVEDMKELMESYKKIIKQLNDLAELKV